MRIIGIDPGTASLGYAILDCKSSSELPVLVTCGVICTDKRLTDAARLREIREDLQSLVQEYQPQYAAIEKIFFFKNPKTIIPVAQARGVCLEVLAANGLSICEYTPLEMKKIITGHGMADKKMVSEIIHKFLNIQSAIKPDDAVDAIGLALSLIRSDLYKLTNC